MPAKTSQVIAEVAKSLQGRISQDPYESNYLFLVNTDIRTPKMAPMNEMLAIYCCMFYLGSLVRYRPEILEAMLLTKDAWLIERFVKSAPLTFLRLVRNQFDRKYLVFTQR